MGADLFDTHKVSTATSPTAKAFGTGQGSIF
jgi:hypothetical protein